MSRRHLEDTLFLHDSRQYWYVRGAWRPKLSGCGGGMARIEFFAKWALENAISRRHLEDTLFLHDQRRDWYVFGTWGPKLSGMRRWDGPHCVFRQVAPRKGDVTTAPRRIHVLTRSPSELLFIWCVENQAEWNAVVGWPALRFSPNGPSKR